MDVIFAKEIKQDDKLSAEDILKLILSIRKITNLNEFINPIYPADISLFDFNKKFENEFKKSIKILEEIKKKKEMIVVYTDYDADGITGGAILWETLYNLGFNVMPYVPDRRKEGYGFSITGIDNVINNYNPALIISVDHGITKIKEIEYLKKKGVKTIITDHHLKGEITPNADAIFHIPSLSGAGVSYFFSKEIFNYFKNSVKNIALFRENFFKDYLAFATIGTIADLVPLTGPSRSIVKYGLEVFHKLKRLGIKYILKEAKIENENITPYEVGFIIAPRINAVGRIENAIDALRLLCTKKEDRALHLANLLGKKNRQRQDILDKSVKEAIELLKIQSENFNNLPKIIILKNDKWHEGIIGLIAAKITEKFYRPTIILTKSDGVYKASARSITGFHITNFLRSHNKYLIDVGGHEQAAGFTIEENQILPFIKSATSNSQITINKNILKKKIITDIKIPINKINLQLAMLLEKLQPFGIGNPQVVFLSEVKLITAKIFGKNNEHIKLIVKDCVSQSNSFIELVAFNKGAIFSNLFREQELKVIYTLEIDRWGGKNRLRGRLIEIIM